MEPPLHPDMQVLYTRKCSLVPIPKNLKEGLLLAELDWQDIDNKAVDTARVLAADAVEKVGNGHPGTAISLAPVAHLLYQKVMRHDPSDKDWVGRDRFILSIGHSSLTQYVQLYLGGFGLELEDIEALRTWGSKTPGHPEYGHTDGVEITTGPLGQGLASAVGFAFAQRYERGLFDPNAAAGESPFDHHIYVVAGDGDLQEGVTSEASSLAGHQKLGNLIAIYDSNEISIEDNTLIAYSEDVQKRYESYGWQVLNVSWRSPDGYQEDPAALYAAIEEAKKETDKPTLIILETIIGWPTPEKQDSGDIHGAALGAKALAGLKETLGFDPEKNFQVDQEVIEFTRGLKDKAAAERAVWQEGFDAWAAANPAEKSLYDRLYARELPQDIEEALPVFEAGTEVATRAASGKVLNALAAKLPELWGGSADLAGSNNTTINDGGSFAPTEYATKAWPNATPYGRTMHFGIREHAAAAIINGISLHGPTRSYAGTFLIFSDYQRPALRLAALMNVPSVHVWTHDSFALGEDGPTHQPIEQLATLRAIPNFTIVRPADANEVSYAWLEILKRHGGPTGIALTRQNVPVFARGNDGAEGDTLASAKHVARGAYVLAEAKGNIDAIIIATGSEVYLALEAREELHAKGIGVRVVSAPSLEWFEEQSAEYQESVLPANVTARVSVEAGSSLGWQKYTGSNNASISIDHFGASADYKTLYREFGITTEAVVAKVQEVL